MTRQEGTPDFHISDDPHVHAYETGVHYLDGETYVSESVIAPAGTDREELREIVADARGNDTDEVMFADELHRTPRGRKVIGFHRWRSSWDPRAEKGDPNLN